jgi:amino acid transporter
MNPKIREHVDYLFATAPKTPRALELKEELISNLNERYADLLKEGEMPEAAFSIVIGGIGDLDELLYPLREETSAPDNKTDARQKFAWLFAAGIGLCVLGFVFPILLPSILQKVSFALMFLTWAVAAMLIIFSAVSLPRYRKKQDTIVENFKEFNRKKDNRVEIRRTIHTLIWLITIFLFLFLGLCFGIWEYIWMLFILAPILNIVCKLCWLYQDNNL